MQAQERPFQKVFWRDYFAETRHLDLVESGVYLLLLGEYWVLGKVLPVDKDRIYQMLNARTPKQCRVIDFILGEFFKETPQGFLHEGQELALARFTESQAVRSESGRKAAYAKHNKPYVADANRMRGVSESNANQNHIQNKNHIDSRDAKPVGDYFKALK